ncbi:unnamed protein product [Rotaria magnacalcarata]
MLVQVVPVLVHPSSAMLMHRSSPVHMAYSQAIVPATNYVLYYLYIGESDSTDNTLSILHKWSRENPRVVVQTYGNVSRYITGRTERIAYCRNNVLDNARKSELFISPGRTFYLAIDLDINTRLDEAQFLTNFDYSIDEWGAMTASQFGGYYDIWALRDKVVNYDCWHRATNIIIRLITLNRGVDTYISVHQKSIPPDHPLIPVDSAFGGTAIYQIKYINGCSYSGYQSHEICEHVPFNLCVTRNKGQIFINPKFQVN